MATEHNIKKIYDIINSKVNIGDFDSFKQLISTDDGLRRFYDVISKRVNIGEYDEFRGAVKDAMGLETPEPTEISPLSDIEDIYTKYIQPKRKSTVITYEKGQPKTIEHYDPNITPAYSLDTAKPDNLRNELISRVELEFSNKNNKDLALANEIIGNYKPIYNDIIGTLPAIKEFDKKFDYDKYIAEMRATGAKGDDLEYLSKEKLKELGLSEDEIKDINSISEAKRYLDEIMSEYNAGNYSEVVELSKKYNKEISKGLAVFDYYKEQATKRLQFKEIIKELNAIGEDAKFNKLIELYKNNALTPRERKEFDTYINEISKLDKYLPKDIKDDAIQDAIKEMKIEGITAYAQKHIPLLEQNIANLHDEIVKKYGREPDYDRSYLGIDKAPNEFFKQSRDYFRLVEAKDKLTEILEQGKEGLVEGFTENALSILPLISDIVAIAENYELSNLSEREKKGKLSPAEQAYLNAALSLKEIQRYIEDSFLYGVGRGVANLAGYATLFGATGKIFTKTASALSGGMVKLGAKNLPQWLSPVFTRFVPTVAGSAVQSLTNLPAIIRGTQEYIMDSYNLSFTESGELIEKSIERSEEDLLSAFAKSFGKNWAEFLTERAGIIPETILGKMSAKLPLKKVFAGLILKKYGKSGAIKKLESIKDAIQWHGFLSELFEEEINAPIQSLIDKGDPELMSWKERAQTALVLAVPSAIGGAVRLTDATRVDESKTLAEAEAEISDITKNISKKEETTKKEVSGEEKKTEKSISNYVEELLKDDTISGIVDYTVVSRKFPGIDKSLAIKIAEEYNSQIKTPEEKVEEKAPESEIVEEKVEEKEPEAEKVEEKAPEEKVEVETPEEKVEEKAPEVEAPEVKKVEEITQKTEEAEKPAEIREQEVAEITPTEPVKVKAKERDVVEDEEAKEFREKGYRKILDVVYKRRDKLSDDKVVKGADTEIMFSTDKSAKGKYVLIEVNDLVPSHKNGAPNPEHAIPEAQPRDRTALGKYQPDIISNLLNPSLLILGHTAYDGAPTVNERGEVIQGNGRAEALRLYWQNSPDDPRGYREALLKHADLLGLDKEAINKMKKPVLVRMVDVSDKEAILLGQYSFKDMEAVSTVTTQAAALSRKASKNTIEKISQLFLDMDKEDIEESISTVIKQVGKELLDILIEGGVINPSQRELYQDKNGMISSDGADMIKNILLNMIFLGGSAKLPEYFLNTPGYFRLAVERSLAYILSNLEEIGGAIRDAVQLYNEFLQSNTSGTNDLSAFGSYLFQIGLWDASPIDKYPIESILVALSMFSPYKEQVLNYKRLWYNFRSHEGDLVTPPRPALEAGENFKEVYKKELEMLNKYWGYVSKGTSAIEPKETKKTTEKEETKQPEKPKEKIAPQKVVIFDNVNIDDEINKLLGEQKEEKTKDDKQLKALKEFTPSETEKSLSQTKDVVTEDEFSWVDDINERNKITAEAHRKLQDGLKKEVDSVDFDSVFDNELSDLQKSVRSVFYKLFKTKILFFRSSTATRLGVYGFTHPSIDDYIFINVDTNKNTIFFTACHEYVHHLKIVNPGKYAKLENALKKFIKLKSFEKYYRLYNKQFSQEGEEIYPVRLVLEESIGNILAYVMSSPKFWKLFKATNPNLSNEVYNGVSRILKRINDYVLEALPFYKMAEELLTETNLAMETIARLLSEEDVELNPEHVPGIKSRTMFLMDFEDPRYKSLVKIFGRLMEEGILSLEYMIGILNSKIQDKILEFDPEYFKYAVIDAAKYLVIDTYAIQSLNKGDISKIIDDVRQNNYSEERMRREEIQTKLPTNSIFVRFKDKHREWGQYSKGEGSLSDLRILNKELIPTPVEHVAPNAYDLREHQRFATNLILTRFLTRKKKAFMLADGQGTGKTRVIITTAVEMARKTNKAVLIVVPTNVVDVIYKEASAMGINLASYDIEIGTYKDLSRGKKAQTKGGIRFGNRKYVLAIYDEAHNLKNFDSQKTIAFRTVDAEHSLFATGTVFDKIHGSIYFFSQLFDISENELYDKLGLIVEKKGEKIRLTYKDNIDKDIVNRELISLRDLAIKDGGYLRRDLPYKGIIDKMLIKFTPEQLKIIKQIENYWNELIEIVKENEGIKRAIAKIYSDYDKGLINQIERDARLSRIRKSKNRKIDKSAAEVYQGLYRELSVATEHMKLDYVYERVLEDLSNGKQVVVYAETVNRQRIEALEDSDYKDVVFNGFLTELYERLLDKGIAVSTIFGDSDKAYEIAKFQKGITKVALSTFGSGGVGISLDDIIGDSPRVMYVVTPNYAADTNEQTVRRISRLNTKSQAEVYFIFAPESRSDLKRSRILSEKLAILNRMMGGTDTEMAMLDYSSVSQKPVVTVRAIEEDKVVISGDTFSTKDIIKELGGIWEASYNGWVLHTEQWEKIKDNYTITSGINRDDILYLKKFRDNLLYAEKQAEEGNYVMYNEISRRLLRRRFNKIIGRYENLLKENENKYANAQTISEKDKYLTLINILKNQIRSLEKNKDLIFNTYKLIPELDDEEYFQSFTSKSLPIDYSTENNAGIIQSRETNSMANQVLPLVYGINEEQTAITTHIEHLINQLETKAKTGHLQYIEYRKSDNKFIVKAPGIAKEEEFNTGIEAYSYWITAKAKSMYRAYYIPDESKYVLYRMDERGNRDRLDISFDTKREAEKFIADHASQLVYQNYTPNDRILLSNYKRIGAQWRKNNRNITPKDFIDTFKFRGILFTSPITGYLGQDVLNALYDSFMDLVYILNLPPEAISLFGYNSLLVGGILSEFNKDAYAYYKSLHCDLVIGSDYASFNSIAHEWFHSLDGYLGLLNRVLVEGYKIFDEMPELSIVFSYNDDLKIALRKDVYEAYKRVMHAVFNLDDSSFKEMSGVGSYEQLNDYKRQINNILLSILKVIKDRATILKTGSKAAISRKVVFTLRDKDKIGKLVKEMLDNNDFGEKVVLTHTSDSPVDNTILSDYYVYSNLLQLDKYLKKYIGISMFDAALAKGNLGFMLNGLVDKYLTLLNKKFYPQASYIAHEYSTVFYELSSELGKKYKWFSYTGELMARAFSIYVYHKLKQHNMYNSLLYESKTPESLVFMTDITSYEVERIVEAFDNFFNTIKLFQTKNNEKLLFLASLFDNPPMIPAYEFKRMLVGDRDENDIDIISEKIDKLKNTIKYLPVEKYKVAYDNIAEKYNEYNKSLNKELANEIYENANKLIDELYTDPLYNYLLGYTKLLIPKNAYNEIQGENREGIKKAYEELNMISPNNISLIRDYSKYLVDPISFALKTEPIALSANNEFNNSIKYLLLDQKTEYGAVKDLYSNAEYYIYPLYLPEYKIGFKVNDKRIYGLSEKQLGEIINAPKLFKYYPKLKRSSLIFFQPDVNEDRLIYLGNNNVFINVKLAKYFNIPPKDIVYMAIQKLISNEQELSYKELYESLNEYFKNQSDETYITSNKILSAYKDILSMIYNNLPIDNKILQEYVYELGNLYNKIRSKYNTLHYDKQFQKLLGKLSNIFDNLADVLSIANRTKGEIDSIGKYNVDIGYLPIIESVGDLYSIKDDNIIPEEELLFLRKNQISPELFYYVKKRKLFPLIDKMKSLGELDIFVKNEFDKYAIRDNYVVSPDDLDIEAEANQILNHPNPDPELLRVARAIKEDPKTHAYLLAELLTRRRHERLDIWLQYLGENFPDMLLDRKLYILSEIFADMLKYPKKIALPYNRFAIEKSIKELHVEYNNNRYASFLNIYRKNLRELFLKGAIPLEGMEGVVYRRVPSKREDPDNFEKNCDILQSISYPTWCLANGAAPGYLEKGRIDVIFRDDDLIMGVRYEGDEIAEIQGKANDGIIPEEGEEILAKYIRQEERRGNILGFSNKIERQILNILDKYYPQEKLEIGDYISAINNKDLPFRKRINILSEYLARNFPDSEFSVNYYEGNKVGIINANKDRISTFQIDNEHNLLKMFPEFMKEIFDNERIRLYFYYLNISDEDVVNIDFKNRRVDVDLLDIKSNNYNKSLVSGKLDDCKSIDVDLNEIMSDELFNDLFYNRNMRKTQAKLSITASSMPTLKFDKDIILKDFREYDKYSIVEIIYDKFLPKEIEVMNALYIADKFEIENTFDTNDTLDITISDEYDDRIIKYDDFMGDVSISNISKLKPKLRLKIYNSFGDAGKYSSKREYKTWEYDVDRVEYYAHDSCPQNYKPFAELIIRNSTSWNGLYINNVSGELNTEIDNTNILGNGITINNTNSIFLKNSNVLEGNVLLENCNMTRVHNMRINGNLYLNKNRGKVNVAYSNIMGDLIVSDINNNVSVHAYNLELNNFIYNYQASKPLAVHIYLSNSTLNSVDINIQEGNNSGTIDLSDLKTKDNKNELDVKIRGVNIVDTLRISSISYYESSKTKYILDANQGICEHIFVEASRILHKNDYISLATMNTFVRSQLYSNTYYHSARDSGTITSIVTNDKVDYNIDRGITHKYFQERALPDRVIFDTNVLNVNYKRYDGSPVGIILTPRMRAININNNTGRKLEPITIKLNQYKDIDINLEEININKPEDFENVVFDINDMDDAGKLSQLVEKTIEKYGSKLIQVVKSKHDIYIDISDRLKEFYKKYDENDNIIKYLRNIADAKEIKNKIDTIASVDELEDLSDRDSLLEFGFFYNLARPSVVLKRYSKQLYYEKAELQYKEAMAAKAIRDEMQEIVDSLYESFKPKASRTGWEKLEFVFKLLNGKIVKEFIRKLIPLMSHLNAVDVDSRTGQMIFEDFNVRAGYLTPKEFEEMRKENPHLAVGKEIEVVDYLLTEIEAMKAANAKNMLKNSDKRRKFIKEYIKNNPITQKLIVGEKITVDGKTFYQLYRPVSAVTQRELYDTFSSEYPTMAWIIDYFINPKLRHNRKVVNGISIPIFNRFSLAEFYKENSPYFEELPGYTPDVALTKSVLGVIYEVGRLLKAGTKAGGRYYKTGSARENYLLKDIFNAFSQRTIEVLRENGRKEFFQAIIKSAKKISPDASIPKGYVPFDAGMHELYSAIKKIRSMSFRPYSVEISPEDAEDYKNGVKKLPKNCIKFDYDNRLLILQPLWETFHRMHPEGELPEEFSFKDFLGEAYALLKGRYIIPERVVKILIHEYSQKKVLSGVLGMLDRLLRYFIRVSTQALIVHPMTFVGNFMLNELFTMEHLARTTLSGLIKLIMGNKNSIDDFIKAEEIFKNIFSGRFMTIRNNSKSATIKNIKRIFPDEIFEETSFIKDVGVSLTSSIADDIRKLEFGSFLLKVTRYGFIDLRQKQRLAYRYLVALGKIRAKKDGLKGEARKKFLEEYIKNPPMVDRVNAIGMANSVYLNYADSPAYLENFAKNEYGRLLFVFPRFGFHFLAKQLDGIKALMTFHKGKDSTERIERLAHGITTLVVNMGLSGVILGALGIYGDDDEEDARKYIGSSEKIIETPEGIVRKPISTDYITANRIRLNSKIRDFLLANGLGESGDEFWIRLRNYPPLMMLGIGALAYSDAKRFGFSEGIKTYVNATLDLLSDFISLGGGMKILSKTYQELGFSKENLLDKYNNNVPFVFYLYDNLSGSIMPGTRIFDEVVIITDPIPRRKTKSKYLNYNLEPGEQLINAIRNDHITGIIDRILVSKGILKPLVPRGEIYLSPLIRERAGKDALSIVNREIGLRLLGTEYANIYRKYNLDDQLKTKDYIAYVIPGQEPKYTPAEIMARLMGLNIRRFKGEGYLKELGEGGDYEE